MHLCIHICASAAKENQNRPVTLSITMQDWIHVVQYNSSVFFTDNDADPNFIQETLQHRELADAGMWSGSGLGSNSVRLALHSSIVF